MAADDREVEKLQEYLATCDALIAALDRRHEVLDAVSTSGTAEEAIVAIARLLDVAEAPARAVVDSQFRRYTALEGLKLRETREAIARRLDPSCPPGR